jgi:hypothetical protein
MIDAVSRPSDHDHRDLEADLRQNVTVVVRCRFSW